ncbi:MAG: MATE family efflux transporter [Muribaculum sp.]|nr:MATE family efflux transporter [Muribaculum sp.]
MNNEEITKKTNLDRTILRLTVPTVLSNISVPLLGLCDTAVAGHMGEEKYLAAIAIGSVMMSMVYWLFGFLRGGTSGLTATAFGSGNSDCMGSSLLRSSFLGLVIGVILLLLHVPILNLLLRAMGATAGTSALAAEYFNICIWGAVPMMLLTAMSGWFVGMQSTDRAMWVNIGVSLLNVVFTLSYVYLFGWGFKGIALGTLTAQWVIIVPAIVMAFRLCRKHGVVLRFNRDVFADAEDWKRMFSVNSNLFFRSACLIAVTMVLYACSARMGDVVTGANAVIQQLFMFFSYFMDGFAYTGEALIGRYHGADDKRMLTLSVRKLIKWGCVVTVIFVAIYAVGLKEIVSLLSDSSAVIASVLDCRLWVLLIPVAGAAAFVYDGFYIGLTKTRPMLYSTLGGMLLFVGLLLIVEDTQWLLWMSFTCYLALRSLILILLFPKSLILNS